MGVAVVSSSNSFCGSYFVKTVAIPYAAEESNVDAGTFHSALEVMPMPLDGEDVDRNSHAANAAVSFVVAWTLLSQQGRPLHLRPRRLRHLFRGSLLVPCVRAVCHTTIVSKYSWLQRAVGLHMSICAASRRYRQTKIRTASCYGRI